MRTLAAAIALGTPLLATAPAGAQAPAPSGGASAGPKPVVETVTCRTGCAAIDRARAGSIVRVTGEALEGVVQVLFNGRRGRRDDRFAAVVFRTGNYVDVAVPKGARTGALRALAADGQRSRLTRSRVRIVRGNRGTPRVQARVDARRVFVGGARKAGVSFFVGGQSPATVGVALIRRGESAPLQAWTVDGVTPGTVGTIEWDGLLDGAQAPEGRYDFVVVASGDGAGAQAAQSAGPSARSSFLLLAHRFPVAGPHNYGGFEATFGGGRGHEGQDVFAKCGTPLVAAIGGTVKHVATHSRAGNYVVIAGADGFDYAYMHLREPTPLAKGQAVATGAPVGAVGDTGRASGCHLHFEMWSAPGWYTGGKAVDPLPYLRAWDAQS